jgi:hypothetical protein
VILSGGDNFVIEYGHHSDAEAAFLVALEILKELEEAGVSDPSFRIFSDGSCSLMLGYPEEINETQLALATKLLHSERVSGANDLIELSSCYGLINTARERGIIS